MNPENQPFLISHAQNREDIILSGFFHHTKTGFYVDVGANDPAIDSVTKNFYEKGWRGINIEPISRLYKKLEEERPRDINLNIGISDKRGHLVFREYKAFHGLSTFVEDIKEDYDKLIERDKKYKDYVERKVEIKTLKQVFDEQEVKEIDFLKVDVEGYESEVINGNDWGKYRPKVICIEANHIVKDWRPFLTEKGYELVFFDGINNYYIDSKAGKSLKEFSYPETMLPTPIIDYRVVGIIEYYKKAKLEADAINAMLNNDIYVLRHSLYTTQQHLAELSGLKGLTKALLSKINTRIEEVILPTRYQQESVKAIPETRIASYADETDPAKVFESIRLYDMRYLTKLNPPKHGLRYLILKIYRKVLVRLARGIIKLAYKTLRKAKHMKAK